MNKTLFKNPYIERASFSFFYFPLPDIEREIAIFEDGLKKIFSDRAVLTRVPRETNPTVPRFIFQNTSNKKLEVSVVRATISFQFRGQAIDKFERVFPENVKDVYTFFKKKGDLKIESFISDIQLRYPLKDLNFDIEPTIHQEFLNVKFEGKLIKSAFSFRELKNDLSFEYFVGSYNDIHHTIRLDSSKNNNEGVFFKLSDQDGTLTEKGLSLGIVVTGDSVNEYDDNDKAFDSTLKQGVRAIHLAPNQILF